MIDRGNAPSNTGIGVYTDGLAQALRAWGSDFLSVVESTSSITSTNLRPLRRIGYLFKLHQLASKRYDGANVVHFTNVYTPKRRNGVAYVTSIHDLDAIVYPSTYSKRYRLYFEKIVKMATARAHLVLTESDYVRSLIIDRYSLSEDKVRAIGIGISPEFASLASARSIGSHGPVPTVLFVGSLSEKKNTLWLVSTIIKGIRSEFLPQLKLVLAGNAGFGFGKLSEIMETAPDIVAWVRNPPLHELVKLYKQASVFVLPSITEGFGIPLVEAMYCGIPIVASRIPTSVEVASKGAHFFDLDCEESFYEAINQALEDKDRSARMTFVENHIQQFLWPNIVPKYINVYRDAYDRI
jgi:glycosyltransferase involved in cell wall biosynthesis